MEKPKFINDFTNGEYMFLPTKSIYPRDDLSNFWIEAIRCDGPFRVTSRGHEKYIVNSCNIDINEKGDVSINFVNFNEKCFQYGFARKARNVCNEA